MRTFKVKINQSSEPTYWYSSLINEVFEVRDSSSFNNKYIVVNKHEFDGHYIDIHDCEIIEEIYDYVNPNHYKNGDKETWEDMLEIWGKEAFVKHCEITAFKYIQRLGKKPNNSVEQDLEKARWYLNKAYDIKNS